MKGSIISYTLPAVVILGLFNLSFSHDQEVIIDDPLTDGTSVGNVRGGTFVIGQGWKTLSLDDRIKYDPGITVSNGEISFDIKGWHYSADVFPGPDEYDYSPKFPFFGMVDGTPGNENLAAYRMYMQIYGEPTMSDPNHYKLGRLKLRLNVAAYTTGGEDDPNAFEVITDQWWDWEDPEQIYHFRLVWGNGHMRWYKDGEEIMHYDYTGTGEEYAPPDHLFYLGWACHWGTNLNCTYSNFKIIRYFDNTPPEVLSSDPSDGESGVGLDKSISIIFSEVMDKASVENAFSVLPNVSGRTSWGATTFIFEPDNNLDFNTSYTVTIDNTATDFVGNPLTSSYIFTFTTRDDSPLSQVGRYEPWEILLTTTNNHGNAYLNVTVEATFNGPNDETININGFWDSGKTWKVRMAPTSEGLWTYNITCSQDAQLQASGSYMCVESDKKGFIRKNPDYPYTFAWDDGTPFLWMGDTSWRLFTSVIGYYGRFKDYIDHRAEEGFNHVHGIISSYINDPGFWQNEGGFCWEQTSSRNYTLNDGTTITTKDDYNRLNPKYFQWIDRRVEYMISKGVYPGFYFSWAQEFGYIEYDQFVAFEKYIVSRYAAYPVFWTICGEFNEVFNDFNGINSNVFKNHGNVIYEADPYGHPITMHPVCKGGNPCADYGKENWLGYVAQQRGPPWDNHIDNDRKFNKPVVNEEYGYAGKVDDDNDVRKAAWSIFTAGGFFTAGFYTTYAPDKGGWDLHKYDWLSGQLTYFKNFAENTKWWQMNPHDELLSTGNCLVNDLDWDEYIIYLKDGGSVNVDLSNSNGLVNVEWFNPRYGEYTQESPVVGGGSRDFTAIDNNDWVLHIGGEPPDIIPPNPPQSLKSPNQTESSIALAWDPPDPASDGDTADSYKIYREGNLIGTTTNTIYESLGLTESTSYNYAVYSVDDANNVSEQAAIGTFTTKGDTTPPDVVSLSATGSNTVRVAYDEKVEQTSSENTSNYLVNNGITVQGATLQTGEKTVILTTTDLQVGISYQITITGVKDQSQAQNEITTPIVKNFEYVAELEVTNITVATGRNYVSAYLNEGDEYYIDRTVTVTDIPAEYEDLLWIMTANDDKQESSPSGFLSYDVNQDVIVYVGYDPRLSLPGWLSGWTDSGDVIRSSAQEDKNTYRLYSKGFSRGKVTLGPNAANSSSSNMYIVLNKASGTQPDTTPPNPPTGVKVSTVGGNK